MNDGYCLAYRSAWLNPIFRDLLEAGIWNWIYQSCAWKETTVRVNGCVFDLKRGELVTTISFISQGFRISPQSTRTLIKNLEKSGMINIRTNKQATIISVCNYDKFQDLNYTGNKRTNKRVTIDQQTPNNNKNTLNTDNTLNTIIHTAFDDYNSLANKHGLAIVQKLTDARKSKLLARLKDCGGLDGWNVCLEKVRNSEFLTGSNKSGWKADFDFIVTESKFSKIMEGSYDNKKQIKTDKVTSQIEDILQNGW